MDTQVSRVISSPIVPYDRGFDIYLLPDQLVACGVGRSRLTSLPIELLIYIIECSRPHDFAGESIDVESQETIDHRHSMYDLCLVCRHTLPVAQAELFNRVRLDLGAHESSTSLRFLRSISASSNCAAYAKRTEMIYFTLTKSTKDTLLPQISEACSNVTVAYFEAGRVLMDHLRRLTLIVNVTQSCLRNPKLITCFAPLRRIVSFQHLQQLSFICVDILSPIAPKVGAGSIFSTLVKISILNSFVTLDGRPSQPIDASSMPIVNTTTFPALRHLISAPSRYMIIDDSHNIGFYSVYPQLDRLELISLPPSTSVALAKLGLMKLLSLLVRDDADMTEAACKSLASVKAETFLWRDLRDDGDWTSRLGYVKQLLQVVQSNASLKRIAIDLVPSTDYYGMSDWELQESQWMQVKEDFRKICLSRGILMISMASTDEEMHTLL